MNPIKVNVTLPRCRGYDKHLGAYVYRAGTVELCLDVEELAQLMCGCLFNKRRRSVRARGAIVARAVSSTIQEGPKWSTP